MEKRESQETSSKLISKLKLKKISLKELPKHIKCEKPNGNVIDKVKNTDYNVKGNIRVETNIQIKKEREDNVDENKIYIKEEPVEISGQENGTHIKEEVSDEMFAWGHIKEERDEVNEEVNAIREEIEVPISNYIQIKLEREDFNENDNLNSNIIGPDVNATQKVIPKKIILKKLIKKKGGYVLENTNKGTTISNSKLNDVSQTSKLIKLDKTTKNGKILKKHLKKPIREKRHKCDFCDYKCATKTILKVHTQYRHTKERNFPCHLCDYKSVTKTELNKHLCTHTGEKHFMCGYCGFKCSQKTNLRGHIQYKHTKERNYSCPECEYKSVTKSGLNAHLRTHSSERPYMCDLCDYKSSQRGLLKSHILNKHTEEKRFSCHLCKYKCVKASQLNRHIVNHTKEKTFMCDLCDFGCKKETILKNHKLFEHRKKLSCHICQGECVAEGHLSIHVQKQPGVKLITYGRKRNLQNSEQSTKNSQL